MERLLEDDKMRKEGAAIVVETGKEAPLFQVVVAEAGG